MMTAYERESLKKEGNTLKRRKSSQKEITRRQIKKSDMEIAFARLRLLLPPKNHPKEELSEVEVLRQTLKYITHLSKILQKQ